MIVFVLLFPALLAAISLLDGWVLSVLWRWFVVPSLRLPELSVVACIGLALAARSLVGRTTASSSGGKGTAVLVATMASPLFTLLLGWVVKAFM